MRLADEKYFRSKAVATFSEAITLLVTKLSKE